MDAGVDTDGGVCRVPMILSKRNKKEITLTYKEVFM